MNEQHEELQEAIDAIRTGIKAGDSGQIFGSGGATGGNSGGDTDPGRNGLIGSGT